MICEVIIEVLDELFNVRQRLDPYSRDDEWNEDLVFAHTYVLVTYWKTSADQCGYMALPWECFMMRTPITLTLFLIAASIPTIVIERAIATYFSSRYEKFGKSIAIILVIAQFAIGIGSFLFVISNVKLFETAKAVYCSTTTDKNATKRFHSNKIHANLSNRYQIMENINSIRVLSPMIAFHSLFMLT
ncbi:hypothetical protein X798_06844 [Onchocerca flexuosa]|uniref:G_PROTEIN_RECEP_F1_2 domain-containing protein n=1 Tax=Onchocerca flexuosa TaxID=387005 RepID=A0A238BLT1_9BILA|nr:hypothetical protein X798_06844 [Onchocerca flexuosa]